MKRPFVLLALALVACSGGEADGPSGAGAGGSGGAAGQGGGAGSGGAIAGAGGTSAAGGSKCDGQGGVVATPPPGGKKGLLQIAVDPAMGGAINTDVAGAFASGGYGLDASDCAVSQASDCVVRVCAGPSTAGAPKLESAGTITITGAAFPMTLAPTHSSKDPGTMAAGDWVYGSAQAMALFVGGETLTVTASGATISAFTTTVKAPAPLSVSEPADGAMVDPQGGATFSWDGGDGDAYVTVELGTTACGITTRVTCTFPSKDGHGTVPPAALAALHGNVATTVSSRGTSNLTVGDYDVTIDAVNRTGGGPKTLVLP